MSNQPNAVLSSGSGQVSPNAQECKSDLAATIALSRKFTLASQMEMAAQQWSASNESKSLNEQAPPHLKPNGNENYLHEMEKQSAYDCVAFLIQSSNEQILLARQPEADALWFPFVVQPNNQSWDKTVKQGFDDIMSKQEMVKVKHDELNKTPEVKPDMVFPSKGDSHQKDNTFTGIQMYRLQLAPSKQFATRRLYYIKLKSNVSTGRAGHFEWVSLSDIALGAITGLWGPEPAEFSAMLLSSTSFKSLSGLQMNEFTLEEAFLHQPRSPPVTIEEKALTTLGLSTRRIERVYVSFVTHLYPALYMTFHSFRSYLTQRFKLVKSNDETNMQQLFAAFNYHHNGYLSFHELLLGLACLQLIASGKGSHDKDSENMISDFISRYLGLVDQKKELTKEEAQALLGKVQNWQVCKIQFEPKLNSILSQCKSHSISVGQFIQAFFEPITSKIRQVAINPKEWNQIFVIISTEMKAKKMKALSKLTLLAKARFNQKVCSICINREYRVARHLYEYTQRSTRKLSFPNSPKALASTEPPLETESVTADQYSLEYVFNGNSLANHTIRMIRLFAPVKGITTRPIGLMQPHRKQFLSLVLAMHHDMDQLLKVEDKCQRVESPCYIIGDVHGNLEDLLTMEKVLWPHLPLLNANLLFLGDYVDRGCWSVECAMYLCALKILCPNKVTLLRGNHEERLLQNDYTYKRECKAKYGRVYGQKVWELTNRIFDKLPVSAVVDQAIYCAHGGIPLSTKQVSAINSSVQQHLPDPYINPVAWEILWNDPCDMAEFNMLARRLDTNPATVAAGYVDNVHRQTAYLYNAIAAKTFLQTNGLSHIIRAHEWCEDGYKFHFGNLCATIFSCSHYCGNDNLCVVVLVDNRRIRICRVDTTNNACAMNLDNC